eukprot:5526278-Pleurochrysis_carterae.AAC.2
MHRPVIHAPRPAQRLTLALRHAHVHQPARRCRLAPILHSASPRPRRHVCIYRHALTVLRAKPLLLLYVHHLAVALHVVPTCRFAIACDVAAARRSAPITAEQ